MLEKGLSHDSADKIGTYVQISGKKHFVHAGVAMYVYIPVCNKSYTGENVHDF